MVQTQIKQLRLNISIQKRQVERIVLAVDNIILTGTFLFPYFCKRKKQYYEKELDI